MRTCGSCGREFEPAKKSLSNPNYRGDFCSRRCANKARLRPLAVRFRELMALAPVGPNGCQLWPAATDRDGYGVVAAEERHQVRAHRVSYELAHGPVPAGLLVLHRCDNRTCVNPAHLFAGTHADNMLDRDKKGRNAHGERHGRTKLTEDDVRAIRKEAAETSQQATAARYGISQVAVSMIVRRKTWSHVE